MSLSPISVASNYHPPVLELDRRDVYPPKPASVLLARTATQIAETGARVLDLGTGSGICGLWIKRYVPDARVVMTDINVDAIAVATANARRNGCDVDCLEGDLLAPLEGEMFDLICCHPPAVPHLEPTDWGFSAGLVTATNGGADGADLVVRFITEASQALRSGGQLLLLLPHWSNTARAYQALSEQEMSYKIVAQERVEFFPWTEGKPTRQARKHLERLTVEGIIDVAFDFPTPSALVSVVLAAKGL